MEVVNCYFGNEIVEQWSIKSDNKKYNLFFLIFIYNPMKTIYEEY